MLQIIQHAIYLHCIWEIRATFQFKIFLFSLVPPENIEIKNAEVKIFYVFRWQKGKQKYFELKGSMYFPNARKIYSMLSSYLQHKVTRFVTQHVVLYVT